MSIAIRVEKIRDEASRSEQIDLRGMIRLEQSGEKANGEKCSRSERSKNITEKEKSHAKRQKKSVAIRSERIVRKLVLSRVDQAV